MITRGGPRPPAIFSYRAVLPLSFCTGLGFWEVV